MLLKPIAPDAALSQLQQEGYSVEVREQHLLLHAVPYVTSSREVARGTLICTYVQNAGAVIPPDNHQVWWTGEYPCFATGMPIEALRNEDCPRELFPSCHIQHRFSNKPDGISNFADHYSKLTHYAQLIQAQARVLDGSVDARGKPNVSIPQASVSPFAYEDSASARASIQGVSARLSAIKLGLVGLGGTGSYILDQLAKTPVAEIHLFDGDCFLQHNAFRSPGAAASSDFASSPNKADYFKKRYELMHRGIFSHPHFVDIGSVATLDGLDFVFVCVDQGAARSCIVEHLVAQKIPFIDVGMNLQLISESSKLIGTCRVTLCTAQQNDHVPSYVPMDEDRDDAIYHQNIQIADMNALNAQLAVMKWKQFQGFYQDDFGSHNLTFSVNTMSLVRAASGA